MSDELQPVIPAESEDVVEREPVAEVASPVVETANSEEVLEEIAAKFDDLLADADLEPSLGMRLREAFNEDLGELMKHFELPEIDWSLVSGLKIKDGVDANHKHHEVIIGRMHSLEMAKALFASGLYDLVLKED